MSRTRMTTLALLLLELSPFVLFKIDFSSALSLEYPLEYFDGTWQKCRTGLDDVSRSRMTTLPFLLLALSPFVMSNSDYSLISCLLSKSKTIWNIFMILGRNVEQDQATCRVQNDNSVFLFLALSPFLMSDSDYPMI